MVTDLTYVPTWAGVAYVCFIIDASQLSYGVDLGDVDGAVLVLAVESMWSHMLGSCGALCSTAVTADTPRAYALLHDVFASRFLPASPRSWLSGWEVVVNSA